MEETGIGQLFVGCRHEPAARCEYDGLRGGFVWEDELPPTGSPDRLRAIAVLAPVIAYRASLTRGKPAVEHEERWRSFRQQVPSWPGFREERIHGSIETALRAADLRSERCLDEFDQALDELDRGSRVDRPTDPA